MTDFFADYRHLGNSKLPSHQATLRVLKAAEDSILSRQLPLSADNYYNAMWPLLFHQPASHPPATPQDPSAEWTAVIVSLVSKVIESVTFFEHTGGVADDRYSELYAGVTQVPFQENATVAKGVCTIVAFLMTKCPQKESLHDLHRRFLLTTVIDARPKVRRHAQDMIAKVLPSLPVSLHEELFQFINMTLQESGGRRDCQQALHILPFLKRLLADLHFGVERQEEFVSAVEHCLQLGNNHLSISVFDVVEVMLMAVGGGIGTIGRRVHSILLKHQPPNQVQDVFVSWLTCFSQSVAVVADRQALTKALNIVFEAIQSDEAAILVAGKRAVEQLLSGAGLLTAEEDLQMISASLNQKINVKRFDSFHPATLDICLLTMEAFKTRLVPGFSSTIQLLALLHDRRGFCLQESVEIILQRVCGWVGVDGLLDLIPLRLLDSGVTKNGWLIGVLNKSITNDRLAVFKSRLLPAAQQLIMKAEQVCSAGREHEAKILDTVASQIINTIHGFLKFPTDFDTHFDDAFAAQLAAWMTGSPQLRAAICNGLADLINDAIMVGEVGEPEGVEFPRGYSVDQANQIVAIFSSQFAKKFLPCLFNIAVTSDSQERSFVLRCCESVLSCLDGSGVREEYLGKLIARLPAVASNIDQTTALLDLASCLIKNVTDNSVIERLLSVAVEGVTSSDGHVQKRSYRILTILNQHCPLVLTHNQSILDTVFVQCAVSCDSSARKQRFKLLSEFDISVLTDILQQSLVPALLPELMMGTKEVNHKCRSAAFDVIVRWGRHFSLHNRLQDYFDMVMAGLAAKTPSMMAGAVLCLSRLVFEFRGTIQVDLIKTMLNDAITILSSPCREVVKAAIGFVKVSVLVLPKELTETMLSKILAGLLVWAQEHHQHFKMRVRHIVERLIRMFGYDVIRQLCPSEHHKLLENIQLIRERRLKRQRNQKEDIEAKTMKPFDEAMFGTDSGEDEVLAEDDMELVEEDDLTMAMSKKMSLRSFKSLRSLQSNKTSKSGKNTIVKTSTKDKEFKTNRSGKMIINESDQEDKQVNVDFVSKSTDQDDHDFYNLKRKKRTAADSDSDHHEEHREAPTVKSRFTSMSRKTSLTARSKPLAKSKEKMHGSSAYVPLTRRTDKLQSDYFMKRKGAGKRQRRQ